MGKQNFIQGGFKGKVGNVIGAGWKDILTIRSYTKPANPKTERQKTVRNAFKLKVKASQLANQCNYGSSLFSSTSNTSWGLRMAAASSFYAEGKNLLEFVPLIPYGYTPDYPTSADPQTAGGAVVLSWDTTDDLSGRSVNVLIWALNDSSAEYEPVIIAATVSGSSGAWTATASVPAGFSVGEDSYLTAVSSDDASFSDKTLYQPPVSIGTSIVDLPFTLTLASGPTWTSGNDYVLFTFTPSETLSDTANLTPASSAYGVLQGDFVTDANTAAAQVVSNVVTVAVPITLDSLGQRPLFVSGSTLTLGAFAYADDTYRYIFEGATFSLAETPTQQQMTPESQSFSFHDTELACLIKTTSAQATLGTMGYAAVNYLDVEYWEIADWSASIYPLNETGAVYASCDLMKECVWGSTAAPKSFTNPVFILNGVSYEIVFTNPMFVPTQTTVEETITSSNDVQSTWMDIGNRTVLYVDIYISETLRFAGLDMDGYAPSITFTQSGVSHAFTYEGVSIERSNNKSTISYSYTSSSIFDDGTSADWSVAFTEGQSVYLEIPNTDGFRFVANFTTFTKSFSGQSS
mgnify:CR=1 FL=1